MALTKVNNDLQDALAAAQPTITSVGTLTGFTSTGIDDNATSNAITITSDEKVGIGIDSARESLGVADSIVTGDLADSTTTVYRLEPDNSAFIRQLTISDRGGATAGAGKGNAIIFSSKYTSDVQQGMAGIVGISESISGTQKGALAFLTRAHDENPNEKMRISSSGEVLIGTTSQGRETDLAVVGADQLPTGAWSQFGIYSNDTYAINKGGSMMFGGQDGLNVRSFFAAIKGAKENSTNQNYAGYLAFFTRPAGSVPVERGRYDSSGNFLVGKTTDALSTAGAVIRPAGNANLSVSNAACLHLNRLGGQGHMIQLYNSGTSVGNIGSVGGILYVSGPLAGGLKFSHYDSTHATIFPVTTTGGIADNLHDLGYSGARFDDIYATNGTIQTSDRNEKQDIAELSDAEQRVAVACKGLLRKFRWKDSVAEKGDDARIHFGIIAQDLQVAFAAQGLDAGDYAMFILSTWWETQTEVDAVEAVEATEDTEAVEAADAYTRTDMFYTLAEAPTGATERTRLGVRYPELLAFIISAI